MSASFSAPLRLVTAKRCLATKSCTNSWRTAKCVMRPGPRLCATARPALLSVSMMMGNRSPKASSQ
eukprot:5710062-Alexandrium_andersonii.AAC.1